MHITKDEDQMHECFWGKINAKDAQKAELLGKHTTVQLDNQLKAREVAIACDCKNAMKRGNKK